MKRLSFLRRFASDYAISIDQRRRQWIKRLFMVLLLVSTALTALATNLEFNPSRQAANASDMSMAALWQQASFPVENFQAYTSPFGYREDPYSGNQRFHYGLDLAAPMGSYIRSWWNGQVIEVSDDSSCGTSAVVQSGSWMHIYCHMQGHVVVENGGKYLVDSGGGLRIREGQAVDTGTRIGRIGMTGRTTGPHLHWGLKYDGDWVDPALVLRAMYSSQQASAQTN
ncbi:M23 family metallopeptidase [Oscillatoria sp. CS-180]|uniref:M23 family metallopeptidase n=1 Tax=Oscillatoria sp. CS-180 TaxID=3021720 RepID=UPI00232BCE84|nr:M23 family metallopeptidase [Oscillatoria sp. CS-180]MDB9524852.1 M23 family metallopeptidase [Oscillatoria sp. CS-180]